MNKNTKLHNSNKYKCNGNKKIAQNVSLFLIIGTYVKSKITNFRLRLS